MADSLVHHLGGVSKVFFDKISENKKVIAGAALAYYLYKKVRPWTEREHSILSSRKTMYSPPTLLPISIKTDDESSVNDDIPDQSAIDSTMFPQYFLNRQGLLLYVRRWPVPNPCGLVFIVHGLAEHIGRYEALALFLNRAGYSVVGIDHQGHGQSDGDRAYIDRFDNYCRDLADFINAEEALFEEFAGGRVPAFIFGHSLGGLITVRTLLQHPALRWPWSGAIISAAALTIDPTLAHPVTRWAASFLSKIVPKLPVTALDCEDISSVKIAVEDYERDALTSKNHVCCLFGLEILKAAEDATKRASEITVPALIIHGSLDSVTSVQGSRDLANNIGSEDVTFVEYKHSKHEVLNDVERKDALQTLLEWVLSHTKMKISKNAPKSPNSH